MTGSGAPREATVMTRGEVAALLGIEPEAVRSTLRRYGIRELRGYPRDAVENLKRPGRGYRTDLHTNDEEDEMDIKQQQQRQVDAAAARAKAGEVLSEALDMADNGWAGPEDARVLAGEVRKLQGIMRALGYGEED